MKRELITEEKINEAVEAFKSELKKRLNQKGYNSFASSHEILGVVDEECNELKAAVHKNNLSEVRNELLDIAVGVIFGIACIDSDTLDW